MVERMELIKKIRIEKFPVLMRDTSPHFQQAQWIQNQIKEKKPAFCRKIEEHWRQRRILNIEEIDYLQSNEHLTHSLFFNASTEARRLWNDSFEVLSENIVLEFYFH